MTYLILLTALFFVSCSTEKNSQQSTTTNTRHSNPIIGGVDVTANSPFGRFVVGIYDKKTRSICTGSVIRENLILTAAHCIESDASNIKIVFGLDFSAYDSNDLKVLRTASNVEIHPDYKNKKSSDLDWSDLALIQFSGGLPQGYMPAQIITDSSLLKQGTTVQMAGFGATGVELEEVTAKNNKKFNQDLATGEIFCYDKKRTQCYRVTFLGTDRLRSTEAVIEGFTEKEIRMNESHGHGTCVGDSGGPLIYQSENEMYIIGITSRGSQFCDGPAIYTNTFIYLDWIERIANNLK
jgi:V8-like Glu-specific endopeptidase